VLFTSFNENVLHTVHEYEMIGVHEGVGVDFVNGNDLDFRKVARRQVNVLRIFGKHDEGLAAVRLEVLQDLDEILGLGVFHGERLDHRDGVLLGLVGKGGEAGEQIAAGTAKAYKAVENGVVGGYKAIENAVVGGYKAIENGVVGGYKKIEDAFVGRFLTKEGESVEEAKKRLTRIVQDQADESANDESRGEENTDSSSDKDA
jgi:hypothetical protein